MTKLNSCWAALNTATAFVYTSQTSSMTESITRSFLSSTFARTSRKHHSSSSTNQCSRIYSLTLNLKFAMFSASNLHSFLNQTVIRSYRSTSSIVDSLKLRWLITTHMGSISASTSYIRACFQRKLRRRTRRSRELVAVWVLSRECWTKIFLGRPISSAWQHSGERTSTIACVI